jgi:hypothetical protein
MTFYECVRRAVDHYHKELRYDPFMNWFRKRAAEDTLGNTFDKVLVVLMNARFDQGTTAEKALENTRRIFELGLLAKNTITEQELPILNTRSRMNPQRWRDLFIVAYPKMRILAQDICTVAPWDSMELLKNIRRHRVPWLGEKTSRLAVRWMYELIPELDIDMSNSKVPLDSLSYRVASRLGIIDPKKEPFSGDGGTADRKFQEFAEEVSSEDPTYIDEPVWRMGRTRRDGGHCYPTNPDCGGPPSCIFNECCPKLYLDFDPAKVGYYNEPEGDCKK